MRFLISLLSFVCTLLGCNPQPGTTTVTFSSVDGVGINTTKARVSAGNARFECLKSATGVCNYVVFVSDCNKEDGPHDACTTKVVEQFSLASGGTREFKTLPAGARHCLSHDAMPIAPDCSKG